MVQPLALELYRAVIQQVDKTDALLSLALCCLAFRDEAQRCLFRFVRPKSMRQHTQLISTINDSPLRLGPLIHSYCIANYITSDADPGDHVASVPLSLALRSMCNLEHLRNESLRVPLTVLQGCTFQLRILVWTFYIPQSSLSFLFCNFLPAQHSIKRLRLAGVDSFDLAEVPTNLCPMLDFLGATNDFVTSALLRDNRLITQFQWRSIGHLPTMTIQQLNHLQYFQCCLYDSILDTSFTQQLTSLVFLELHFESDCLLPMLQFLQDLPCLEVFVVQSNFHDPHGFISAYQYAFELRPTLKYIDSRYYRNEFYDRFFPPRDDGNGVLVSNTRVHPREVLGWRREYGGGPAWPNFV